MVFTERIAVALLTVFLRSVFRRLPFMQTPIIENTSSNNFMNPHFVVAGGVFYYVTRNHGRSWIERFRTRPNLGPPAIGHTSGEINRLSENKIERARSWLDNNYRTSRIFHQAAKRYMANENAMAEASLPARKEAVSKIRRYKRRWRNHPNKLRKTKPQIKSKAKDEEPQPSTSGLSNILPSYKSACKRYSLEDEDVETDLPAIFPVPQPFRINDSSSRESLEKEKSFYNQPATLSERSEIASVKTIRSRFSTTLNSSNDAPREIRNLSDNLFCMGCSGDHQVPHCKLCLKRKRRRNSSCPSENSQFHHMDKIKVTSKEFKIPHHSRARVVRKTRSGRVYGWHQKP